MPAPPIQPSGGVPVSPTQPPWGVAPSPTQPPWGVAPPLTQPLWVGPGNASPAVPGDITSGSNSRPGDPGIIAASSAPPLPELEQSLEYIPARDARETIRESQSHHPPVEHHDIAAIAALPTALPDPVSVWQKVKQVAIASGDYEGAELTDVPMLRGWEPEDECAGLAWKLLFPRKL
ncbi:hypothetical protein HGM15179_020046 [Zosterops borbonicus]|uniref:Uncharacterized protein n=1 Tax=Zosterops borbonicus TaxID=364589 RepID=A0A8K1D9G1_9PASS|nr:hypothetical protein HGM15179_020046 [Zosterops borbonicus]